MSTEQTAGDDPTPPEPLPDVWRGLGAGAREAIFYATSVVVSSVVAAINALSRQADLAGTDGAISLSEALVGEYTSVVGIWLLLPAVTWLARRHPWTSRPMWRWAALHLVASVPFSLVHLLLMCLFRWALYGLAGYRYDVLGLLADGLYEYRKDVLTYALILFIYWAWREWTKPRGLVAPPGPALNLAPLELKDGARRIYVRPAEIVWIEAAGNYAELHLADGKTVLHRTSLSALERDLGPAFARIHRSRLINRAEIAELAANDAGDFTVTFRGGRTVGGSRRYRAGLTA